MPDDKTPPTVPVTDPNQPGAEGDKGTPPDNNKGTVDIEKLDAPVKDFVQKLLKDKQDANSEAQQRGQVLKALTDVLGVEVKDLKPESLKAIKADSDRLQGILKSLQGEGDSTPDPVKEIERLKPFEQRAADYESAMAEMVKAALEGVPEEMRDLVPTGTPLDQFKWIQKAQAKGILKTPAKKVGDAPPASGSDNTGLITEEIKQKAAVHGMSPEEYAQVQQRREQIRKGQPLKLTA